jgi:AmiR/NasT family two-component response regulator
MAGDGKSGNGSPFENTARVSQAVGMVSVQAACGVDRALELMRERAEELQITIDELARAVIDGTLRFD